MTYFTFRAEISEDQKLKMNFDFKGFSKIEILGIIEDLKLHFAREYDAAEEKYWEEQKKLPPTETFE